MPATMSQYREVERQVRDMCVASGLPESTMVNAEIKTSKAYITVNLVSGTYAWVLRFRFAVKGQPVPRIMLHRIWLAEDTGELVPVKLVNGKELPWGYT